MIDEGDFICTLLGCPFPVVLREIDGHFVNIGTCFILGLMNGEAAAMLNEGKAELRQFQIQ